MSSMWENGKIQSPTKIDRKRRVVIVNYICPEGHSSNEEHTLI